MSDTLAGIPSSELLDRIRKLVQRGNAVEAELLVHLAEVDARQLYLEEGCSSMFTYGCRVLHFAEGVAYKRIQAARAARRHPEILDALRCGDLHLTAVGLLAPKLTEANCKQLIAAARHLGADEIRKMLADREPKPSAPSFVRRIHEAATPPPVPTAPAVRAPIAIPTPPPPAPAAAPRARTEPLGAERYRVQFTADRETHAQLEELRALMRHQVPDGDVGKILAKAISVLQERVRKQKFGETSAPRSSRDCRATSWSGWRRPAGPPGSIWNVRPPSRSAARTFEGFESRTGASSVHLHNPPSEEGADAFRACQEKWVRVEGFVVLNRGIPELARIGRLASPPGDSDCWPLPNRKPN